MAISTKKSTAAAKSAKPAAEKKSAKAAPPKPAAKPAPAKPAVAKAAPAKTAPAKAAVSPKAAARTATEPRKAEPRKAEPKKAAPKAAPAPTAAKAAPAKPGAAKTAPAAGGPAAAPAAAATGGAAPGGAKAPPPRLTVRTPVGADELKQKIGALATATANIRNLKRSLNKSFYEIGLILKDVDERKLYEVKGYGSFEAFLEREIDLGKQLGMRLARAVQVFQRDAAVAAGLDRVQAAVAVFDGEVDLTATPASTTPTASGIRSPIPFHKQ